MIRRLLFTTLLNFFLCSLLCAQILINTGVYKCNFSNTLHEPRYVSYTLYKGGGNCDRAKFHFKNDKENVECATDADYAESSYDKGHLANAEDFAFDCEKDELTFRYYNCLPQTTNLNRGIWKKNETLVRKWSQTQKLYIICGGYFKSKKIGNIAVPDYCWKVVQSCKTKDILFCGWFKNSAKATVEEISVSELEKRLKSKVIVLK
ncbi:MAG: DNA/RNA non-specific endonuclease [Bacteroidota bacterium]